MASLNIVDRLPHITVSDEQQSFKGVLCYFYILAFDYSLEVELNLRIS
jgi:hypothetical protein